MCRIDERVYIGSDGSRQTFEETFPCTKAHRGKLCSNVKRRTTEYFPKSLPVSRDDASSPASNNPPTPTGTGSYLVEQRRPSTREDQRIKPEITIAFGGSKKGKAKKYPLVSVSSGKSYKRSSLGAASVGSNEQAVESPGSDASYTHRTGFPETPVEPPTYSTRTAVPRPPHRHTSSSSSYTSQPPSLQFPSEPESPAGRRGSRPVIHNPPTGTATSSPPGSRGAAASSGQYRTTVRVPQASSRDNVGADGLSPLDYSEFHDRSASSHASSGRAAAPEITDRAVDRERRRKHKEDEKRRQEESDRRLAEEYQKKEEEKKQVRFEIGRGEERERLRNENKLAESEKRRAEEREDARKLKREQEKRATKKPEREKRPPPTSYLNERPSHGRRRMSQAELEERNRLLLETEAQMAREREAAEQREREERAADLRQQQETNAYWDPRGGDRYPMANNSAGIVRRNSISSRRGSVSSTAPPTGLARTNSNRRVSIIQPTPPPLQTSFSQTQYSTRASTSRPSSSHQAAAQPFSPSSNTTSSRPPSARYDNPFAQPPTRTSNTSHSSQDNPFAQPPTRNVHLTHDNPFPAQASVLHSPPETARDPWANDLREALPRTNSHREQRTLQQRGEQVINRSGDDRARSHRRAQQATQTMGKVVGYENDYESSSENEEDKLAGYGARLGRAGRRGN